MPITYCGAISPAFSWRSVCAIFTGSSTFTASAGSPSAIHIVFISAALALIDIGLTFPVFSLVERLRHHASPHLYIVSSIWPRFWFFTTWSLLYFLIRAFQDARRADLALQTAENRRREAELLMLRSQINPHFLFNALNTVLSESDGNQRLTLVVRGLSDYMRYALGKSSKPLRASWSGGRSPRPVCGRRAGEIRRRSFDPNRHRPECSRVAGAGSFHAAVGGKRHQIWPRIVPGESPDSGPGSNARVAPSTSRCRIQEHGFRHRLLLSNGHRAPG